MKHWIAYGTLISLLSLCATGWYNNYVAYLQIQSGRSDDAIARCEIQVEAMVRLHNQVDLWCEVNHADAIQRVIDDYRKRKELAVNNESLP